MIPLSMLRDRDRVLVIEAGRMHPSVSFARAGTAMAMNGAGVLVAAAANVPRYEYDQAGNYLGLLIEEARTNICLQSQNLSVTPWGYNNTTATVSTTTYAGIAYYTIAKNDVNSSKSVSQTVASVVSGTVHTLTLACRAGSSTQMGFGLNGSSTGWGGSSGTTVAIISGPGTLTQVASNFGLCNVTGLSTTVDTVVTMTRTYTASETVRVFFYPDTASSVVNGASNLVTRVQVEAAANSTSYIPTTTATAARAAESVSIPLTALRYSTSGGTALIKFDTSYSAGDAVTRYVLLVDANNRFGYFTSGLSPKMYNGTTSVNSGHNVVTNKTSKLASAFSAAGMAMAIDGFTAVTGGTTGLSATSGSLNIGGLNGSGVMNGHIKSLCYYPRQLSNTELQKLTA